MAVTFPAELRRQVIDEIEAGASARGAAARFGVGSSTAIAWVRRWRESGEPAARRQGNPGGSKLDAEAGFLLDLVAAEPGIGLAGIGARLRAERGVSAGISTLWRFFEARGIGTRDRRARAAAAGDRDGPRSAPAAWCRPASPAPHAAGR